MERRPMKKIDYPDWSTIKVNMGPVTKWLSDHLTDKRFDHIDQLIQKELSYISEDIDRQQVLYQLIQENLKDSRQQLAQVKSLLAKIESDDQKNKAHKRYVADKEAND